jgi:hypothetical protein
VNFHISDLKMKYLKDKSIGKRVCDINNKIAIPFAF